MVPVKASDRAKGPFIADRFAGKVAVIRGASTCMGLATAKRLAEEGMNHGRK